MLHLVGRYLTVGAVLLALSACHKAGAKTPEESFVQLERAVAAGDAAAFYKCLDRATQGAIEDTYKEQRLQRTIVQAKYPEAEAGPALAKLAAAAEEDAPRFFVKVATERKLVEGYRKRLGSVSGPIARKADGTDAIYLSRQDGMPFKFARNGDGSWGFSEQGAEWLLEKERASHAVKTVRDNAALYQKAGTP
jgi:hypothetical protein